MIYICTCNVIINLLSEISPYSLHHLLCLLQAQTGWSRNGKNGNHTPSVTSTILTIVFGRSEYMFLTNWRNWAIYNDNSEKRPYQQTKDLIKQMICIISRIYIPYYKLLIISQWKFHKERLWSIYMHVPNTPHYPSDFVQKQII